jgi:hypothetical protein
MRREGLNIVADLRDKALAIRIHTSKKLELSLYLNDKMLGSERVDGSDDFKVVRFPLDAAKWNGPIRNLEIRFEGAPNTDITIDLLKVERGQSPSK